MTDDVDGQKKSLSPSFPRYPLMPATWQAVPAKRTRRPERIAFRTPLYTSFPIELCTYLERMTASRPISLPTSTWRTVRHPSSKAAPQTTPPSESTLRARSPKIPPDEDRSRSSDESDFAHETDFSWSTDRSPIAGQACSQAPQSMQISAFTIGREKPRLSRSMEMHPLGQAAEQAPQPQQASASVQIAVLGIDDP